MLQFESWLFLDEATYNVVKRGCGFTEGCITYNYADVEIERKRLKGLHGWM
jgi:hypothetical protein